MSDLAHKSSPCRLSDYADNVCERSELARVVAEWPKAAQAVRSAKRAVK